MKNRIHISTITIFVIGMLLYLNEIIPAQNIIKQYPIKYNTSVSKVFRIFVNGEEIFVEDYKDIHYANFGFSGTANIKVEVPDEILSAEVSPRRFEINAKTSGKQVEFQINQPRKLVLYINDYERLFIFADAIDKDTPYPKSSNVINIEKYKIDNTGSKIETAAIQKAIDEAASQKKILFFPAGVYLTGTLNLRTNSSVYLDAGAMILGSSNRDDYPQDAGFNEADKVNDPEHYSNKGWKMTYSRLILIGEAENVKLWGRGIIDGQGAKVRPQGKPANLIRVRRSKNVLVEGLILRDPAAWNTHILASDGVTFRDIKMINDRDVLNTDGIDPDGSKNVTVDNCFMYCSDDNIAIKTSGSTDLLQSAENIVVKNCVFLTKKSSMKLGTETRADIRNVTFENNNIVESDRGMSLYSRDGATFENIYYTNNYFERLFADNQQKILQFELADRKVDDTPGYVRKAGQIKNVVIKNCTYDFVGKKKGNIEGLNEEHKISGVHFENLKIKGKLCNNLGEAGIQINNFVDDVTFKVSGESK